MWGDGSNWNDRASHDERQAQRHQAHGEVNRHGRFSIDANDVNKNVEPEFPAAESDEPAKAADWDTPAESSLKIGTADRPRHGPCPRPLTACVRRTECSDHGRWQALCALRSVILRSPCA